MDACCAPCIRIFAGSDTRLLRTRLHLNAGAAQANSPEGCNERVPVGIDRACARHLMANVIDSHGQIRYNVPDVCVNLLS